MDMTFHDLVTETGEEVRWPGSTAEQAARNAEAALSVRVYPVDTDFRLPVWLIAILAIAWAACLVATLAVGA